MPKYSTSKPEDNKAVNDEEQPVYENVGWRNRIVGYAEVDPHSLLANEDNWRTHPYYQREVVGTALEEVGWVQDIIVNVRQREEWDDKGKGIDTVLDGHLRVLLAMQTDQPSVPVKYVDLTPEEEQAVLLVLDTSTGLATADKGRLKALLENVEPMNDATKQLLVDLAEKHKIKFDEEDTLTSEDEFGDFSEYGVDDEQKFVDFKFGDYSAKISQATYDIFVKQVNLTKEETGKVMIDNVIRSWIIDFDERADDILTAFEPDFDPPLKPAPKTPDDDAPEQPEVNRKVIPVEISKQVAKEYDMTVPELMTGLSLRNLDEEIMQRLEELVDELASDKTSAISKNLQALVESHPDDLPEIESTTQPGVNWDTENKELLDDDDLIQLP